MDEFYFTNPPQQNRGITTLADKEKALEWANDLPLTNTAELSSILVNTLSEINQSSLDIVKRFEVVEVLRSLTRTANENLEKTYLRVSLPMSTRPRSAFESASGVLAGMAKAYLVLVDDVQKSGHKVAIERLLPYVIYHAISYLARLLVSHYVVYEPEPKGVWAQLHRLYLLAKKYKMEGLRLKITRKRGDTRERSIDKAYKRVLLVSQAAPYHLMQGEVNAIYNLMEQWSVECKLLPLQKGGELQQVLVVDTQGDRGPSYLPKDGSVSPPGQGWVFKCDGIRQIMNKKIREFLAPATSADKVQHTLGARLERDMYFRLADAWAVRLERVHERTNESVDRAIVVGLCAFHYRLSDGEDFAPERVEVLIKKKGVDEGDMNMLELVSEEEHSWKWEKEIEAVESGVNRNRLSDFHDEQDVWGDVHANKARHEAVMKDREEEIASSAYQIKHCEQLDKSEGGLKLFARENSGIQLKVGELIGLQYPGAGEKTLWRLASVRWVKNEGHDALNFGVRFISDEAKPMAARGKKGAGEGGEYIRTLVVPEVVQNKKELTLVTPAAVYDLDSEVVLNNGTDLRYIRLTSLVETTNTFSRFRFEVLADE